jgi:cytochrome c oxidase assembly protein subunit 15
LQHTFHTKSGGQRVIGIWLVVVAGMVFAMVVLGGVTRLTESGLSMVEWRPVTGWLPPLSQEAWEQAFGAYQHFPEYQKVNAGMTLAAFKGIYWLEYLHRLWGRLIGVAFALPFLFFLAKGWIDRGLAWRLFGMFVLGGLQGVLGWYMVKSGLVDRPDVSPYRLAAHLGLALVIYGYILLVAFGLLAPPRDAAPALPAPTRGAIAVAGLVLVTALAGGFVAGLDAGFAYNTFPLMDGELVPRHLFAATPMWRSFFEDVTTVQFTHRVLAMLTVLAVLVLRWSLRGRHPAAGARRAADLLTAWVFVQFALGVATLLSIVAVPLAAAHQASAIVLWTLALWTVFELTGRGTVRRAYPVRSTARVRIGRSSEGDGERRAVSGGLVLGSVAERRRPTISKATARSGSLLAHVCDGDRVLRQERSGT